MVIATVVFATLLFVKWENYASVLIMWNLASCRGTSTYCSKPFCTSRSGHL